MDLNLYREKQSDVASSLKTIWREIIFLFVKNVMLIFLLFFRNGYGTEGGENWEKNTLDFYS